MIASKLLFMVMCVSVFFGCKLVSLQEIGEANVVKLTEVMGSGTRIIRVHCGKLGENLHHWNRKCCKTVE